MIAAVYNRGLLINSRNTAGINKARGIIIGRLNRTGYNTEILTTIDRRSRNNIPGYPTYRETLRRCYREAVAAAAAAEQPKRGRVVFYDEASLEFLADCIPSAVRRAARARIFARCTPQEAEELAQTVALYFAEDGDVRRCAEKLFVHRNTFQYRMDTVKRKTGLDLRRPRDAALLYLVLRQ